MKKYKIPIMYQCVDIFEVEAESLQKAAKLALTEFLRIPNDKYIDDSFEIDCVIFEEYREKIDYEKLYDEI